MFRNEAVNSVVGDSSSVLAPDRGPSGEVRPSVVQTCPMANKYLSSPATLFLFDFLEKNLLVHRLIITYGVVFSFAVPLQASVVASKGELYFDKFFQNLFFCLDVL